MNLGSMAVGSVLAAFGTALPESSVTLIAVVFGRNSAQKDLGVGAALGGPMVLSTLAYAVVGLSLLWRRRSTSRWQSCVQADIRGIHRDQGIFLWIFALGLLLGVTSFPGHALCALLFVVAYAVYAWKKVAGHIGAAEEEEIEPLKICRREDAPMAWAVVQTLLALAVIGFASHLFVAQLGAIATAMHWPSQMAALLLSPVATELPETMNALIWVRQGKERLALANISGAMMIQATIPSALGLFFTDWRFDRSLMISAVVTTAATAFLWLIFRRADVKTWKLLPVCCFYMVFAVAIAYYFAHRWEQIPVADHQRVNPVASQPEAIAAGAVLYQERCMQCHRADARGDGGIHPSLRSTRLKRATDGDMEWFLRQGEMGRGMPSWASLPDGQRWQIVSYLKSIQQ